MKVPMLMEQPTYYAIIPSDVRYDKRLKANEKLMYGEITCLTQSTGECFASNDYFARLYDTSKETVSRWISNLVKCGYIETSIRYAADGKTIDKRIITLLTKKSIPSCEKNQYPIDKKVKDNNTSINTINIIKGEAELPSDLNKEAFLLWCKHKGKNYSKQGKTLSINKLVKYSDDVQLQMVEQAIMNGWKGLFEIKGAKERIKSGLIPNHLVGKMFNINGEIIEIRENSYYKVAKDWEVTNPENIKQLLIALGEIK